MILEAFADYLHAADPAKPATDILAQWLLEKLSTPPITNVDRVLHCEMAISGSPSKQSKRKSPAGSSSDYSSSTFKGKSSSGTRLLKSLYEYCQSYDQQKWSRFVHKLKASDFRERYIGN